jgi:para-nitrobenzyl esterase
MGAGGTDEESEDCLYLNVYAPWPVAPDTKKLPTMIWIHGGAYRKGSSNVYDRFARAPNRSSVLVTINYRLGAFGFLGSSALKGHSQDGSTGNFGLQDQQAALSWVRQHISSFGGDESQVTVFGESAGGNSVLHHLVLPQSRGLFDRAIIESGSYDGTLRLSDAERAFERLVGGTPCGNLTSGVQVECLLNLSAEAIHKAASGDTWGEESHMGSITFFWGPVVDNVTLSAHPEMLLARGKYDNLPVVIGSNSDEFIPPPRYASDLNETELDNLLAYDFGEHHAPIIKRLYAPANYDYPTDMGVYYSSFWWTAMRIHVDLFMGCGVRRVAQQLLQGGSPTVYTYYFAHPTQARLPQDQDFLVAVNDGGSDEGVRAQHTSEIPYVFGWTGDLLEGSEAELSYTMKGFWEQFAATGDPNTAGSPWLSHSEGYDRTLVLQARASGVHMQRSLHKAVCDYWESASLNTHFGDIHV